MKTEEDEAFDELARRQGAWGGGFPAKRKAAADKLQEPAQEPVAWRRREVGGSWQYFGWEETGMTYQVVERWNKNGFECEAIPATPPAQPAQRPWVGLTDGMIEELFQSAADADEETHIRFARAIEAKLRSINNG